MLVATSFIYKECIILSAVTYVYDLYFHSWIFQRLSNKDTLVKFTPIMLL